LEHLAQLEESGVGKGAGQSCDGAHAELVYGFHVGVGASQESSADYQIQKERDARALEWLD
jgi:hypothetical protein